MCGYNANVTPTPGAPSQIADPNAPILKGDDSRMTQKRKKLFAILAKMLPQAFDVPGTPARHKQGNYKPMTCWYKGATGTSCTAFNPAVMGIACGGQGKDPNWSKWGFDAQQHPGWVDYAPGKSPSVGDTYLLYDEATSQTRHVGIITQIDMSPTGRWVTADGGQNDPVGGGQCAELVPRPWKCSALTDPTADTPYLGGGAESPGGLTNPGRLMGWVNLDDPSVVFVKEDFDTAAYSSLFLYKQEDWQDLITRIATVLANP